MCARRNIIRKGFMTFSTIVRDKCSSNCCLLYYITTPLKMLWDSLVETVLLDIWLYFILPTLCKFLTVDISSLLWPVEAVEATTRRPHLWSAIGYTAKQNGRIDLRLARFSFPTHGLSPTKYSNKFISCSVNISIFRRCLKSLWMKWKNKRVNETKKKWVNKSLPPALSTISTWSSDLAF